MFNAMSKATNVQYTSAAKQSNPKSNRGSCCREIEWCKHDRYVLTITLNHFRFHRSWMLRTGLQQSAREDFTLRSEQKVLIGMG
jgi:hypothetical protein